MLYHYLLFDLDNTLFDFSAAEAAGIEHCARKYGLEWSDEVLGIYREINHEAWTDYEHGRLPKSDLRTVRFSRLFDHFRLVADVEACSEEYRTELGKSAVPIAGAENLVRSCHRAGYKLGMITNGLTEVQRPRLALSPLTELFDFVIVSDEIGVAKPDAAFFRHALERMHTDDPADALVIGDNLNADIRGGAEFGCATCWYNPLGKPNTIPGLEPTYNVSTLDQLASLLLKSE